MRRDISVDELIKFLNPESEYVFYDDTHGFCINTQDVLDHLCAMPSADVQPVVHWIPCSERLPEPNEMVLISVNGEVDADWIAVDNTGYGCWYRTMRCAIDIDAWMPLPEPYQEGEQDE